MARYTGPVTKKARRFGEPIFGPSKAMKKKPYPPGQHGRGRRRKQSEYAVQLMEKQKAKYTYGVLEKQFRNTFDKAARMDGIKGTNLLQLLEARLDNVVYRLGLSATRRGARQLVSHKHIAVNGVSTNIPSFTVQPGDIITVREKSKSMDIIKNSIAYTGRTPYGWFEWDSQKMQGKMMYYPERDDIPENLKEQLIVELYSK
jgi:small subunit ribosomal protein S4